MERHAQAEQAIRDHGPEIFGWLVTSTASDVEAQEAYSAFAEELWQSLARFDGRCSLRTWCYMLARHVLVRVRTAREQNLPLTAAPPSALEAVVRETTQLHFRTDVKEHVRELRRALPEDDQHLLVLRVDRGLEWRDVALVMLGDDAKPDALAREAAALRKRFERVKDKLRELAHR